MQEGKAEFRVNQAFYRPQTQVVRDLGILAAIIYKQEYGQLRVLDAMSGCGVRSLRYWLESHANWIWSNEGNSEISNLLNSNLQEIIKKKQGIITHKNAHNCFFECHQNRDYYDLVDVDCFGSAAPYLSTSLWAVKINGLLYLTSTDGRTATGKLPENSLKAYGAYARSHPAAHEQGLRLLIGSLQQQAASRGLGIKPIFSLFSGQTYRVMVRLVPDSVLTAENYGFLGYCHQCGNYQTVSWQKLGKTSCNYDNHPLTMTGAMWLGELGDRLYLSKMATVAQQLNWYQRIKLLQVLINEAEFPPYFYTLREIGSRGNMDLPKRKDLIKALEKAGYKATVTHINPEAIKTNADFNTCVKICISFNYLFKL